MNQTYIAWSDASVRDGVGYISYLILGEAENIVAKYNARVNIQCNYTLEKVALAHLLKEINERNIVRQSIVIYTDFKALPNHINNRGSQVYKQFESMLGHKVLEKYKKCVKCKSGKKNKAHTLSRENVLNWFDYNIAKIFL